MASVRIKGVNAQNGMDVQLDFWTASEGKIASNFWCFYWQAKASALPFHPFQVLRHLVAFVQPYLIGFSYYIIISLPRHRRFPQFALYTHMHQFPSSVKLGRLPPCNTAAPQADYSTPIIIRQSVFSTCVPKGLCKKQYQAHT